LFDFLTDIHGCIAELAQLLTKLGYNEFGDHPDGRKLVFAGDYVDRGPDSATVLDTIMNLTNTGKAQAVIGNHDDKLLRYLKGTKVKLGHGLEKTVAQVQTKSPEFQAKIRSWLQNLPYRLTLDNNKVVVAHAGLPEWMHLAVDSPKVRSHALYGDVDGTVDKLGRPVRKNWALDYAGPRVVVHGHVVVDAPYIINHVYNLDTGCCFGGALTCLRYPEMELVSVAAHKNWSQSYV
jgi:diadenosine tetraphosphatase ApaH/serine/threonine PP2A family protein phosphatase